MGEENSCSSDDGGKNKSNTWRPFYKKSVNGGGEINNVVTTKNKK